MICKECNKWIKLKTDVGFESAEFDFYVCKECSDLEQEAWEAFQIIMKDEIEQLKRSRLCRLFTPDL
jgi:hypothetical protein